MTNREWTEGPWVMDLVGSGRAYGVSGMSKDGYRVPVVVWRGIAKPASEEGRANARLIAAAPDLYEALWALLPLAEDAYHHGHLRDVHDRPEGEPWGDGWSKIEAARDALLRANPSRGEG